MKTVKTFFLAFPALNSTAMIKKLKYSISYQIVLNFLKPITILPGVSHYAVEFPPHQGFCVPEKLKEPFFIDNFEGEIIDYQKLAAFSMKKKAPNYTLFRGIMPGWDNTARTKAAKIYHGSSPAIYQKWLNKLVKYTEGNLPEDRQFLFINAWNEWAEGAYLEPDRNFGYAYLNATSRAISNLGR